MLKLIAEDFIQVDKIAEVLPLYAELIEKTKQEQGCIAYDLDHDLKIKGILFLLKNGLTELHWMHMYNLNISNA